MGGALGPGRRPSIAQGGASFDCPRGGGLLRHPHPPPPPRATRPLPTCYVSWTRAIFCVRGKVGAGPSGVPEGPERGGTGRRAAGNTEGEPRTVRNFRTVRGTGADGQEETRLGAGFCGFSGCAGNRDLPCKNRAMGGRKCIWEMEPGFFARNLHGLHEVHSFLHRNARKRSEAARNLHRNAHFSWAARSSYLGLSSRHKVFICR